ncbi:MAG: iron ABC transporter permease [Eggerthellaceae bacterium]|nr:iron ABC transporter permease [Eggerthellaceae bacterium]
MEASQNKTPDASPETSDERQALGCRQSAASRRANLVIAGLAVFMVVASGVSLMLGRYPIEPAQAVQMLVNAIPGVTLEQTWTDQQATLFFNVRLPRILLALMVGCCLATAGAAFQGTFQNPLVSPDILGASQGAAFGAAIAILAGQAAAGVSLSAFCFSIVTVMLVLLVSSRAKGNRILVTVLAGTMISSLFSAGVSFTKLVADPTDDLPAITYWLMGSLTGAKMSDIALAAVPMVVGCGILLALRWRINILTMGDDEASTMGVNAKHLRLVIILAATMATAASVAISGMIGWVGLVVPHLCRMIVGCDYRKLIPASMFFGASFLLIVDNIARLTATSEIPIGILTAFVGAPFFLYLITRKKQGLGS